MKMKKLVVCMGCALPLLLAGCSSEDGVDTSVKNGLVEISMSSGIESASTGTRGAGMIKNTLANDLSVSFVRADEESAGTYGTFGTTALAGTVASSDNKLSFTPTAYYLANGGKSKLIGWYPNGGTYAQAGRTVTFSNVDGSTDIMVTELKEGNKTTPIASMTFSHVLTQISVKAYAADADAKTVWGGIKSIKIKGKKQNCVITLPESSATSEAKASAAFNGSDDLDLVKNNPADNAAIDYSSTKPLALSTASASPTLAGYAMFAPVAAASDAKITLSIEMENGTLEQGITLAAGYLASNSYVITLKFSTIGIAPTITIGDWVTATAPGEVVIQ